MRRVSKRILLVAPLPLRFELTQDQSFLKLPIIGAKSFMLPLHIATVAGLTPPEFQVELWDESVHGVIESRHDLATYDLVGVTGYTAHLPRAKEIGAWVRKAGVPIAIGGPGISTMAQRYRDDFDIIFIGEAELTWPQFLKDWTAGKHQDLYRQVGPLDLALSPVPRWDLLADRMKDYHIGAVQTSRGCPFDCEFCDVSYLFGRGTRHKPVDRVLEEVALLEKLGTTRIIFCDDNFIGTRRYAKDLLRKLVPLNRSFRRPLAFATELTIDVAQEEELMELLADANFAEIFIGIESPNKESLKETNKPQNYRSDLIQDIRKLQGYGMSIRASFIVGFDHDDRGIFEQMLTFVQDACIPVPSIRVLMAPPGTRLWKRLQKEGRLLKTDKQGRYFGNPGTTNILPKRMTRTELHLGYLDLIEKVYDWDRFSARCRGFIDNVKRTPKVRRRKAQWKRLLQLSRFLVTSADARTRRASLGILWYTFWRARFMVPRMVAIILRQYGYAVRPQLRASIQAQVDEEESEKFEVAVEDTRARVSEDFKEVYQQLFGEVHERVRRSLGDGAETEKTLVEIFADFLDQDGHRSFSLADRTRLMDVTDAALRTSVDVNGILARANATPESPPMRLDRRLSDAVLKALEQDLRPTRARHGEQPSGSTQL